MIAHHSFPLGHGLEMLNNEETLAVERDARSRHPSKHTKHLTAVPVSGLHPALPSQDLRMSQNL